MTNPVLTAVTNYVSEKRGLIANNVNRNDWIGFLDSLGWMENSGKYNGIGTSGFAGMYQVGKLYLGRKDLNFFGGMGQLFGFSVNPASRYQEFSQNPIAQDIAALMEFTGIPDIGSSFNSRYIATIGTFKSKGFSDANVAQLVGHSFTINYVDENDKFVMTDTINLTVAGISGAAHLVGQGALSDAMSDIWNQCFSDDGHGNEVQISSVVTLKLSLQTIPGTGVTTYQYCDGNKITFSTYVKLLQDFDISTLTSTSGGLSTFNPLLQQLITYRKDKILASLRRDNQEVAMSISAGTTDYRETIRSVLRGLDLPEQHLDEVQGKVVVVGGAYSDRSGSASDLIFGVGLGAHFLEGGNAADYLYGDAGGDDIFGGQGNDTLLGNKGADTLEGGIGNDSYIFSPGDGNDVIHDGDGLGTIRIGVNDGFTLSGGKAGTKKNTWIGDHDGIPIYYEVIDGDITSATGGTLRITGAPFGDSVDENSITIRNFKQQDPYALNPTTPGSLGITLKGGEKKVEVFEGDRPVNPYSFNPERQPAQNVLASMQEGFVKEFFVAFSQLTPLGGLVKLALTGPTDLEFLVGSAHADDEIIVPLSPDRDVLPFTLVSKTDVDVDESVQLTATLLNPDGSIPDDPVSHTITIDLDAHDETALPTGLPTWSPTGFSYVQTNYDSSFHYVATTPPLEPPFLGQYAVSITSAVPTEIGDPYLGLSGTVCYAGPGDNHVYVSGRTWVYGEDGRDSVVVLFGTEEQNLYGGLGDDALSAGAGDDYLEGDEGNDLLAGGSGSDRLIGGEGDDVLLGGSAVAMQNSDWSVSWSFDSGHFTASRTYNIELPDAYLSDGDDFLDGGSGDDYLHGGFGADDLLGGDGRDYLDGGAGSDYLSGGAGNDKLFGEGAVDPTNPNAPDAQEYHGDDYLDGGDGDDSLVGGGGADTLLGGDGADLLLGDGSDLNPEWHGDDYLDGGAGDDQLRGDGGDDLLYGGSGDDVLEGDASDLPGAAHGEDVLYGEDGNDIMFGDGGADVLYGGTGDDFLYGDNQNVEEAYQGADELYGEAGNDQLVGSGGNDYLDGGEGDDNLFADAGDDVLYGGDGTDELHGGDGNDLLDGETGNDLLHGDDGDDVLLGGDGDDGIAGGEGGDVLDGGAGTDTLSGEAGDDTLDGGAGDDLLDGGDGNDTLIGGDGADQLQGGTGDDSYEIDRFDKVADTEGQNVIRFVDGTRPEDIVVADNAGGGLAFFVGTNFFFTPASASDIPVVSFAFEGVTLTTAELLGLAYGKATSAEGTAGDDVLNGYAGDDLLDGGAGDDVLQGYTGADRLSGGTGDDVLQGGTGDDSLSGGLDSDIYLFSLGDGRDTLTDQGDGESFDQVQFGEGILSTATHLARQANGDLVITFDGSSDEVRVVGQFNDSANSIEAVLFDDGSEIDQDTLGTLQIAPVTGTSGDDTLVGTNYSDRLLGYGGNDALDGGASDDALEGGDGLDTLDGGLGNDILEGENGLDTYVLSPGSGRDTAIDTSPEGSRIQLGLGFAIVDLAANREGDDLFVSVRGTNDGLLLKDYYATTQSWTIADTSGATATAENIVTQTQEAAADEEQYSQQLLADFVRGRRAQIVADYRAQGYAHVDQDTLYKSWTQSALTNLYASVSRTTTHINESTSLGGGTTSHTDVLTTWSGVTPILPEYSAQIQVDAIEADDSYIYISTPNPITNESTRLATLAMAWQAPRGNTTGSYASEVVPNPAYTYYYEATSLSFSGFSAGHVSNIVSVGSEVSSINPSWSYSTEEHDPGFLGGNGSPATISGLLDTISTTIPLTVIVGGDSANFISGADVALGGGGDDQIYAGHFAYGGEGNDFVEASDISMGGSGDDTVAGGGLVVGGGGNDTLVGYDGATTFEIDPADLGNDRVTDLGDSTARYDRWYYGGLGISAADEQLRAAHPATYQVRIAPDDDGSFIRYVASLDDIPAILELYGRDTYRVLRYLDPLPTLPSIAANDFSGLQPLVTAGVIDRDVVKLDAGVALDDLTLSWSTVDALSGNPYTALDISWGAGKSLAVLIPHANDPIGTGIEGFQFADGTYISLGDLVDRAGPHPSFDPQLEDQHLIGTPGDDSIAGAFGNDTIEGLGGSDSLSGGGGNDVLLGGQGDDNLSGNSGNDVLDGGGGIDSLAGSAGSDTYRFGRGYGQDFIDNYNYDGEANPQDHDRVLFNADVAPRDLKVTRDYNSVYLSIVGTNDQLTISGWFNGPDQQLASIEFSDGTVWDTAALEARIVPADATQDADFIYGTAADDVLLGLGGDDTLVGVEGDDVLIGSAGADYLDAGLGNDLLDGGTGADTLSAYDLASFQAGGQGEDTVYANAANSILAYNVGDGADTIYAGAAFTLSMSGIATANLSARRDGDDLVLDAGTTDSLRFAGWYSQPADSRPQARLQIIGDAVRVYDLSAAIAQFDDAFAQDPELTSFSLGSALAGALLSTSFDHAYGGDLALAYARNGTTEGVPATNARTILSDAAFGSSAQLLSESLTHANQAPVVTVADAALGLNQSVAASSLFTIHDPENDAITQLEFWDSTDRAGSAVFKVDGVTQSANQSIVVDASQLANVQVVGGTSTGTDQLWVRASDGQLWSDWKSFTLTSGSPQAPVVSVSDQTLDLGLTVDVSTLFSATDPNGDAVIQYEFYDSTDRAGSAAFTVSGNEQSANQTITVNSNQLSSVQLQTGTSSGVDQLWVRASDGQLWSDWKSFNLTSGLPQAPAVTVADHQLALNQAVAASTLFDVSDPNGDSIVQYQFWDSTDRAGSAVFKVDGVEQLANHDITITASQLADVQVVGGAASGTDQLWVRASDGQLWSDWKSFTLTTGTPQAPTVSVSDQRLGVDQTVNASTLFSASDPNGDAIAQYQFFDGTDRAGSAVFKVNGQEQSANQTITVSGDQLGSVALQSGSTTGADQLWVRASDGQLWSDWKSFTLTTGNPQAPVVTASDQTLDLNQTVGVSSLFSVSDANGDAIAQYQFFDSTDRASSAAFKIGGTQQAANQAITVDAAQLSSVQLQTGKSSGVDQLWVRASDGALWSDWKSFNLTSGLPQAPTVTAVDHQLGLSQAVAASTLFDVSDPNGDPIAQYQFYDSTGRASSGAFEVDGVPQAANQTITVAGAQLADTLVRSGSITGTDQLWVRASDGQLWSDWKSFTLTSGNPQAPIVTASDQTTPINSVVNVSDLFAASDPNGDSIVQYQLYDGNADAASAAFSVNNVVQGTNQTIDVSAADFASAALHAGSAATIDQLWMRASDGQLWSDWKALNLTTSAGQFLKGSAGADSLAGGAASDILQGLNGGDDLADSAGNNLLDGGAGADSLGGGSGNDLLAGGVGNDTLDAGAGANVIAFNAGDGQDTLETEAGANDTLSLGGGITYQSLSLRKNADDLVLDTGNGDAIALRNWYAAGATHSVTQLQVIADAMPGFNPNGSDALLTQKVQRFDFAALVAGFDQARAADGSLTQWQVMDALLDAHLAGSDTEAMGGDLAYQYGHAGTLSGVGFGATESVLNSSSLGTQPQALQPDAAVRAGVVKLA